MSSCVAVVRTTYLCPHVWQWEIGVVVIFLAWINLIIVCAKFPNIGIYVIMFGKIWGTFLKVLLLSKLLVATFGLTFYMTFSEPQFQVIVIHQVLCISQYAKYMAAQHSIVAEAVDASCHRSSCFKEEDQFYMFISSTSQSEKETMVVLCTWRRVDSCPTQ